MEEKENSAEVIQRASEALDKIGCDDDGDTSDGKRVVLELKDKIIELIQGGVSRRKICRQLEKVGVKVTPYLIEKYIIMGTNKKQDIKAASKTLKSMLEQPELVGSNLTPGIKFVMDNKENIKKLIENGWTMKMVMAEMAKCGVKCSPQTIKKYIGLPLKRKEKSKADVSAKKQDNQIDGKPEAKVEHTQASVTHSKFRNNEGIASKWAKE